MLRRRIEITATTRFFFAGLILIAGCEETPLGSEPGRETGPCIEDQCFDGLACHSDLCVNVAGDTEGDTSGNQDDDGGQTSAGSTSGTSVGTDPTDSTAAASTTSATEPSGSETATGDDSTSAASSPTGDDGTSDETLGFVDDNTSDSVGFIDTTDTGGSIACDIWTQDCPAGEKCNAYADDGGNSWNATMCFPIDPNPDGVGQSCIVDGSGVSGFDTCVEGAICWNVDARTNVGTCVAYCEGSPANPQCDDGSVCAIANDDVLAICVPGCDPLTQDCPAGEGCYGLDAEFVCAPDASGASGSFGDPCEYINACDPGLECINAELVAGCGGLGCCSPHCDLTNPDCPGSHQCTPWFEEGQAPPGFEDVGICSL